MKPIPVGLLVVAGLAVGTARAQVPGMDPGDLGRDPYGRASFVLRKTIFNFDVLFVEIRFGRDTASALAALAASRKPGPELTALIASRAYVAEDAFVEIEFKRDVSLDQFLDGVRQNLERARRANMIDEADFRRISSAMPRWFAFLEDEGIKKGDRIFYRIRPDSLRTVYIDRTGRLRLDQTNPGATPGRPVLGSYFAPGSDFRDGLVNSLLRPR